MQVLQFPKPEDAGQEFLITMLEGALERARNGTMTQAVLVETDAGDDVGLSVIADTTLEAIGMLTVAQRML